jgi:hypothetical protein
VPTLAVSRDTFYAWQSRRASGAEDWFEDRSHATRSCPHRTEAAIEAAVIALRRRFAHLGPRKFLKLLQRQDGATDWPAASTIGDILKKAGLVEKRRRERPRLDPPRRFVVVGAPNEEWSPTSKDGFGHGIGSGSTL